MCVLDVCGRNDTIARKNLRKDRIIVELQEGERILEVRFPRPSLHCLAHSRHVVGVSVYVIGPSSLDRLATCEALCPC